MPVRDHNLETVPPVLASFKIKQTITGLDDLKDFNIGEPIMLTADSEVGRIVTDGRLLGKLVSLTLTDNDDSERVATVQIGGVCRLAISEPYPVAGGEVCGGFKIGTVASLASCNIKRGFVLDVKGETDCIILL